MVTGLRGRAPTECRVELAPRRHDVGAPAPTAGRRGASSLRPYPHAVPERGLPPGQRPHQVRSGRRSRDLRDQPVTRTTFRGRKSPAASERTQMMALRYQPGPASAGHAPAEGAGRGAGAPRRPDLGAGPGGGWPHDGTTWVPQRLLRDDVGPTRSAPTPTPCQSGACRPSRAGPAARPERGLRPCRPAQREAPAPARAGACRPSPSLPPRPERLLTSRAGRRWGRRPGGRPDSACGGRGLSRSGGHLPRGIARSRGGHGRTGRLLA